VKSQEALRTRWISEPPGQPGGAPEHVLFAALTQDGGIAAPLVQKAGAVPQSLAKAFEDRIDGSRKCWRGRTQPVPREALKVLQAGRDEAKALKDDFVSVEHLLLGAASTIATFKRFSIATSQLRQAYSGARRSSRSQRVTDQNPKVSPGAREVHADLTRRAPRKLDPVIGAGTKRSVGSCKCFRAGPRTTRS